MILAGDVGGTKVALGLFRVDPATGLPVAVRKERYASRAYPGLVPIVREFLAAGGAPAEPLEVAAFGVAGPVIEDSVDATNLAWRISGAEIEKEIDVPRVLLVNDLVATAEGIALLGPGDLAVVQEGRADPAGNGAILAAGTGLGAGLLVRVDRTLVPLPSEGGHMSFAPQDEEEDELLRYLRRRHGGHVSAERVVSGNGLPEVYSWLRESGRAAESPEVRRRLETEDPARVISEEALAGRCALCARALEVFVSSYGSTAGNLALVGLATAGVWIAGGIAPKILPALTGGTFAAAFRSKGRFRPLLERIPVCVVLNPETGLLGAARRAMRA